MTATLLLVRHGQTDWNIEGRYQGQDGPGLNPSGREEVQRTLGILAAYPIQAIYSSDLLRSMETARLIGDALNLPVHSDSRLREIHQGVWQQMLYRDIERQHQERLQEFRRAPLTHSPPGGETLEQVTRRVLAALDDIAVQHPDQHAIVVTHKLPIAIVRCLLAGEMPTQVWSTLPSNAQIFPLSWPQPVCRQRFDTWLGL